jgi:ribosomal protein S18 acetylase RimI-like enzyme
MELQIRPATEQDYPEIETMVIDSFEPVTWARTLEERFGTLNGLDWRARWKLRMAKIFAEQFILVGMVDGAIGAMSSSTLDPNDALVYIDLIAVARNYQGHGYGRDMLRATIDRMRDRGAQYVHLDCLTSNENANDLYRSEGFEEVARHIRWFRQI